MWYRERTGEKDEVTKREMRERERDWYRENEERREFK
jgi:hypothetical protein